MTEQSEPGEPGATQPPTADPSPAHNQPRPSAGDLPTGQTANTSGRTPPPPGTAAAKDREAMPPPPPQPRDIGPLDLKKLRGAYDVYHRKPPHALVNALWGPLKGHHPNRRFAVAPLLHGGAVCGVAGDIAPGTHATATPPASSPWEYLTTLAITR